MTNLVPTPTLTMINLQPILTNQDLAFHFSSSRKQKMNGNMRERRYCNYKIHTHVILKDHFLFLLSSNCLPVILDLEFWDCQIRHL